MSFQQINLTIPADKSIPSNIIQFTPDEVFLMIQIGSSCIQEVKQSIVELSQQEIYNNIKKEYTNELSQLETKLVVQEGITNEMESRLHKMYASQIDQLRKQILIYESNMDTQYYKDVDKVRDRYDLLLLEKDKQIDKIATVCDGLKDNIVKLANKSTVSKGSEGEKQFELYANNAFCDFKGYELLDKHTQGGAGDFHLQFEDFDILVDAKNYKKKVPVEQREKIKQDLLKHTHVSFAWLVSLNTSIDKWDKSPIMYEWINTRQCIVYINNLTSFEDPQKILRILWFTCKELYQFVKEEKHGDDITGLKERQFKMLDKVKQMRKTIREINTSINTTKNIVQQLDDQLKEMLESETTNIVESNYGVFDEWWAENIKHTNNNEDKVLSTALWFKFRNDNKETLTTMDITAEKFKQYLKSKMPISSIIIKSKNANSALELVGISM